MAYSTGTRWHFLWFVAMRIAGQSIWTKVAFYLSNRANNGTLNLNELDRNDKFNELCEINELNCLCYDFRSLGGSSYSHKTYICCMWEDLFKAYSVAQFIVYASFILLRSPTTGIDGKIITLSEFRNLSHHFFFFFISK